MTDPKARKVIVIENAFLPTFVKAHIARVLFDILRVCKSYQIGPPIYELMIIHKVPSISFTPSSLLALAAGGRVTGLVVDCGWLETTITPVCHCHSL